MKKTIITLLAVIAMVNVFFLDFKKENGKVVITTIDAMACFRSSDSGNSGSGSGSGSGGYLMSFGMIGPSYYRPDPHGSGGHNTYDITWSHPDDSSYGFESQTIICPNQPLYADVNYDQMRSHHNTYGGSLEVGTGGNSATLSTEVQDQYGTQTGVKYNNIAVGTSCVLKQNLANKSCVERGC